ESNVEDHPSAEPHVRTEVNSSVVAETAVASVASQPGGPHPQPQQYPQLQPHPQPQPQPHAEAEIAAGEPAPIPTANPIEAAETGPAQAQTPAAEDAPADTTADPRPE